MNANRQKSLRLRNRRPELLRDPGYAVAAIRNSRKTVRDVVHSFLAQRLQRIQIEPMAGTNPEAGIQSLFAQGLEAGADSFALCLERDPRGIRLGGQRHGAFAGTSARMPVPQG